MKVTKIPSPVTAGQARPLCSMEIKNSGASTRAAEYFRATRVRKGIPTNECGAKADFLIDGAPRCRPHAGQAALNHLLGKDAG